MMVFLWNKVFLLQFFYVLIHNIVFCDDIWVDNSKSNVEIQNGAYLTPFLNLNDAFGYILKKSNDPIEYTILMIPNLEKYILTNANFLDKNITIRSNNESMVQLYVKNSYISILTKLIFINIVLEINNFDDSKYTDRIFHLRINSELAFTNCKIFLNIKSNDYISYRSVISNSDEDTKCILILTNIIIELNNSYWPTFFILRNSYINIMNFSISFTKILNLNFFFVILTSKFLLSNSNFINSEIPNLIYSFTSNIYINFCQFKNLKLISSNIPLFFYKSLVIDNLGTLKLDPCETKIANSNFENISNNFVALRILILSTYQINLKILMINNTFKDIHFENYIYIYQNSENVEIESCEISKSSYYYFIYTEQAMNIKILNLSFKNNNNQNKIYVKSSALYFLNIAYQININQLSIINCKSNFGAVGLTFYYTIIVMENVKPNIVILNSTFLNNRAVLISSSLGGCAIYIYSAIDCKLNIIQSYFEDNSIFTDSKDVIDVVGAPCIRSTGIFEKININETIFINHRSEYLSTCLSVTGEELVILSIFFLNCKREIFSQDSLFRNNSIPIEKFNSENYKGFDDGVGMISFFGRNLYIKNCELVGNFNSKGGVIYIDGSSNLYHTVVNLIDIMIANNFVFLYGGGLFIGSNTWSINAYITNITCEGNQAFSLGGFAYFSFSRNISKIIIIDSKFIENGANYGGALYFTHNGGEAIISNCIFASNKAISIDIAEIMEASGGAIYINGYYNSLIKLINNIFRSNTALNGHGGVIKAISGKIFDQNSTYEFNEGFFSCCLSFQNLAIIEIKNSVFLNNKAKLYGFIYVSLFCQIKLENIYCLNLKSESHGILISANSQGSVKNLTIKNHNTNGPSLAFQDLLILFICDQINIFYDSEKIKNKGQMIVILKANVSISNFNSSNFTGSGFFIIQFNSFVSLFNFFISSFVCADSCVDGSIIYMDTKSYLTLNNMDFNKIVTFKILFLFSNSEAYLENGFFFNLEIISEYNILKLYIFMLKSSLGQFLDCIFENLKAGAISIENSELYLTNCNFIINFPNEFMEKAIPSILFILKASITIIKNSIFQNNNASMDGGAIYIQNNDATILIDSSMFFNLTTSKNGGAIYILDSNHIVIENCTFLSNKANDYGGAIFYYSIEVLCNLTIFNTNFTNNSAVFGGAIQIKGINPFLIENIFDKNIAYSYGNEIATFPLRLTLEAKNNDETIYETIKNNTNEFKLNQEYPGNPMRISLIFKVLDTLNQTITTLDKQNIAFNIEIFEENDNEKEITCSIEGLKAVLFDQGKITISNLIFYGIPNRPYLLKIFSPIMRLDFSIFTNLNFTEYLNERYFYDNSQYSYEYTIPISLLDCLPGHVYNYLLKGLKCSMCEPNKYTLSPFSKCESCIAGAECLLGTILPKPGFWRAEINSSTIYYCSPYSESCLGGINSNCKIGYYGRLCQTCGIFNNVIYSKYETECKECYSKQYLTIISIIIGMILIIIFILFVLYTLKSLFVEFNNDMNKDKMIDDFLSSAYIKIFINFLQLVSFSNSLNLKWNFSLIQFFQMQKSFSGSILKAFSLDCLISDSISYPMIYFEALFMSLIPIVLLIIIFTSLITYIIFAKKGIHYLTQRIITILIITIFSFQPPIMNYLFNIVNCLEIESEHYYLKNLYVEQCYTDRHYSWLFKLFIPSFIIYGFLLPLPCFIYMVKYSNFLHESKHIKRIGFLSNGYAQSKFYWEFIFFYRKLLIIFILEYVNNIDDQSKSFCFMLIIIVSLWIQAKENPYLIDDLNSADFKATLTAFGTLFFGLFSYFVTSVEIKYCFTFLIFSLNIFFMFIWINRIIVLKINLFKNTIISKYFRKQIISYDLQHKILYKQALKKLEYLKESADIQRSDSTKGRKRSIFTAFKKRVSNLFTRKIKNEENNDFHGTNIHSKTFYERTNPLNDRVNPPFPSIFMKIEQINKLKKPSINQFNEESSIEDISSERKFDPIQKSHLEKLKKNHDFSFDDKIQNNDDLNKLRKENEYLKKILKLKSIEINYLIDTINDLKSKFEKSEEYIKVYEKATIIKEIELFKKNKKKKIKKKEIIFNKNVNKSKENKDNEKFNINIKEIVNNKINIDSKFIYFKIEQNIQKFSEINNLIYIFDLKLLNTNINNNIERINIKFESDSGVISNFSSQIFEELKYNKDIQLNFIVQKMDLFEFKKTVFCIIITLSVNDNNHKIKLKFLLLDDNG